jgi:hypothetical protein
MTTTPSGILSLPLSYLRASLSNSSTFRTWTSTANPAAALARIHYGRAAGTATLPLAIVAPSGVFARTRPAVGHWEYAVPTLDLSFRASITPGTADADAVLDLYNTVGACMTDIEALADTAGCLSMTAWRIQNDVFIVRADDDEGQVIGEHYGITVTVDYEGH